MYAPFVKPVSDATRPARKRKTSSAAVPLIVSVLMPPSLPVSWTSIVESPFPNVLTRYVSEPWPPSSVSSAPIPFKVVLAGFVEVAVDR